MGVLPSRWRLKLTFKGLLRRLLLPTEDQLFCWSLFLSLWVASTALRFENLKQDHHTGFKVVFQSLLDEEPSLPAKLVVKLSQLAKEPVVGSHVSVLSNLHKSLHSSHTVSQHQVG